MFITIEGCEGAGKTSVMQAIRNFFLNANKKVITTREPGGTHFGSTLRSILLSPHSTDIPPYAELFLYLADRNFHVNNVIKPKLEEGYVVVCDRYTDSTLAYQGYARGLPLEVVQYLNTIACENILPNHTFFLDVDPEKGLERARKRSLHDTTSEEESRFENEDIAFHIALSKAYKSIAQENKRFITINANNSIDDVEKEVQQYLEVILL